MKIVWIIFGTLGGLFAGFGFVQLVKVFKATDATTAYGGANLAAAIFPICLGLIVCAFCMQRAFPKAKGP